MAISDVRAPRSVFAGGVVILIGFAVFINYVDRGLLPSAAPLMKDELHLSSGQIGLLISAFFWIYAPIQPLVGWLVQRFGAYRILGIGVALWSVSTVAFGLVGAVPLFLILRLCLGLGESATFPAASKIFVDRLPVEKLGAANAVLSMGLSLGPAFGAYFAGMVMAAAGWRSAFIAFGVISLLWLLPWIMVSRSGEPAFRHEVAPVKPVPIGKVLRQPALWAAGLGHFSANYSFYFVISWLPLFLVKSRGFSMSDMATLTGSIYLVYALSCIVTGWLGDRMMARGASASRSRKGFLVAASAVGAVSLGVCAISTGWVTIASLFVAGASFGFCSPNVFVVAQTLAGPRAAAQWAGVQNGLGNTAGIVAPLITGAILDATGDFRWPFAIAALAALLGVLAWGVLTPRLERIDWDA